MDKLTSRFQSALADAQSLAVGKDHQFMEPAHVFGALLDQQDGSTRPLLVKAGANVAKLRKDLETAIDKLPTVQGTPGDVHVSQDLNRLLNVTDKLAQQRNDQYISSELFVLASFEDKHTLAKLLKDAGASKAASSESTTSRSASCCRTARAVPSGVSTILRRSRSTIRSRRTGNCSRPTPIGTCTT